MQFRHFLEEARLRAHYRLDRLAGHRVGEETHEIAGVSRFQSNADLAVRFEAPDARTVARARIEHDERTARIVRPDVVGCDNPNEAVVDRTRKLAAVDDDLDVVVKNVRRRLGQMRLVLIAALAQRVPKQNCALAGIDPIFCRPS